MIFRLNIKLFTVLPFIFASSLKAENVWWNKSWAHRQAITLDTTVVGMSEAPGTSTVLVRLFDANFQFALAREDGSDLRFVAADGKTILPHQIESYDNLLNEAYIWVKIPNIQPTEKTIFNLYFGNTEPEIIATTKPTDAYDEQTSLVYHFSERAAAPSDTTINANTAGNNGTTAEGSLMGNGIRLLGNSPISIPNSSSLEWKAGQTFTLTTWLKFGAAQANAVIVARGDRNSYVHLLLDQGIPVIQTNTGRSPNGSPLLINTWNQLSLISDGTTLKIFLNGTLYSSLNAALPAMATPLTIGGLVDEVPNTLPFIGELDELTLSSIARSPAWLKLSSINQGSTEDAQRMISMGQMEGGEIKEKSKLIEHLSLFGDIAGNMMFDGWIAIGVCVIMIVVGWTVAIRKFLYLNSIEKGTKVFLSQWKSLSTDLTALHPNDGAKIMNLGEQAESAEQILIEKSPLYHIYQIGSEEIRHRLDKNNNRVEGLSGRSIQAIRASLDAGLVHESHRLSDGLVYLTISIAGGPYVGLLGTVVGVMITFAIIAKSGEVNVNSIAPGIASALLATVVGLVVAIPALFIYSYLNGRIKNSLGLMQVFIDEFVAKMAEFYRPAQEPDQTTGSSN